MASRRSWCLLELGSPNREQNWRLLRAARSSVLILHQMRPDCAFPPSRSSHRYNMATSSSIEWLWARGLTGNHNIARLRCAVNYRSVQDRRANNEQCCVQGAVCGRVQAVFTSFTWAQVRTSHCTNTLLQVKLLRKCYLKSIKIFKYLK